MRRKWLAWAALLAPLAWVAPARAQTGLAPIQYPAGAGAVATAPGTVPLSCYLVINGVNVAVPVWTTGATCPSSGGGGGGGSGGTVEQGTSPWVVAGTVDVAGTVSVSGAVTDSNSAAFQGVVLITPGTPVTAQRSLGYICTTAGNITLTLPDSSTITLPIVTASGAFQTLPFAVTNVSLGSGTAGTFWNLK